MMKVLTFVIPAYNSQHFLDKGVPSMLLPEIMDKLEIIIVNDGSKDATPEVAQGYCDRYPEVVRLISQENKGHGGALNTGCAAAQGKYLKVVDADDWVQTQNLPAFISMLEQCQSDVVLTHFNTVDISNGEIRGWKSTPADFGKVYTFDEIMAQWPNFERVLTFHGMTYRTDFYRQHTIGLSEKVFYEDHEFATFPCCRAKSISAFDLFIYDYRIGDVNQSVSQANQLKRIGHLETVFRRMAGEYAKLPEGAGKAYAAQKTRVVLMSYLVTALLVHPEKKTGRALAAEQMAFCSKQAPKVYDLVKGKYQVFSAMNRLHVTKAMWDGIMNSKLYGKIRNRKSQ